MVVLVAFAEREWKEGKMGIKAAECLTEPGAPAEPEGSARGKAGRIQHGPHIPEAPQVQTCTVLLNDIQGPATLKQQQESLYHIKLHLMKYKLEDKSLLSISPYVINYRIILQYICVGQEH